MLDHVKQLPQLLVRINHAFGRIETILRDLQCRREYQQLGVVTPVDDQCGEHDARSNGRLAVLLADQEHELPDQSSGSLAFVCPEDRCNEVEDPLIADLAECRESSIRLLGKVCYLQAAKYSQRICCLVWEERRDRHEALPRNDPLLPVQAGC